MAEILKARDLGRPGAPIVAVKRILPHLVDDRQFVTMFLDESRVLAQLEHDNVIRTLAVGEVDETPFIALEYVFGPDARNLFHRSRRNEQSIPIAIGCYVMAQVCAGLQYAHESTDHDGKLLGVVHRDVSLQNVLLSFEGEVKLTDFGIAMSAKNVARTEVGVVKGKFGYMSPEQIRGEPMDGRSDVFAAGICLYELLTSERLFSGDSDYQAVERVRNVIIEPPSRWNRMIPSTLEAIVMKALSKHPRDRFQSAGEMRRALLSFMADSGNECSPRQLGQYLRGEFAEELAKYPTPESLRSRIAQRRDDPTGLSAFDHLEPVTSLDGDLNTEIDLREDLAHGPTPIASAVVAAPHAWTEPSPTHGYSGPTSAIGISGDWDEAVGAQAPGEPFDDDVTRQINLGPALAQLGIQADVQVSATAPELPRTLTGTASPFAAHLLGGEKARESKAPREATEPAVSISRMPIDATATYGRVIAIVAGIVLLIATALYFGQDTRAASVLLSTLPVDAEVRIDGQLWPGTESPFNLDQVKPDVMHTLEVRKAGYQTWTSRVTLSPGQRLQMPRVTLEPEAPAEPVRPAAPPEELQVALNNVEPRAVEPRAVEPRAAEPRAKAPKAERKDEAPKARERDKRGPSKTQAQAKPQAPNKPKHAAPAPKPAAAKQAAAPTGTGMLRINSRPWSVVTLDGKKLGNTPQIDVKVSAGAHTIKLVNNQFGLRKTIKVQVAPNETVTKVIELQ